MQQGELLKPQTSQSRSVYPFTGFWARLGALLIDIFVLYAAMRILGNALRPLALAAGPTGYMWGVALIILYFALAEGPLGRGQTLGKAILGCRVLTRDFQPINPGQALLRALLRFGVLLTLVSPLSRMPFDVILAVQIQSLSWPLIVAFHILYLMAISYVMINLIAIGQHPFKWSLYDAWLRTCVVREGEAESAAQLMSDPAAQSRLRPAYTSAAIGFILVTGMLLFSFWRQTPFENIKQAIQYNQYLSQEFSIPGMHLVFGFRDERLSYRGQQLIEASRSKQQSATAPQQLDGQQADSGQSSATASGEMPGQPSAPNLAGISDQPLKVRYSVAYLHFGTYDHNQADNRKTIDDMQNRLYQHCLQRYRSAELPFSATEEDLDIPIDHLFEFKIAETYNLLLAGGYREDYLSSRTLTLSDE